MAMLGGSQAMAGVLTDVPCSLAFASDDPATVSEISAYIQGMGMAVTFWTANDVGGETIATRTESMLNGMLMTCETSPKRYTVEMIALETLNRVRTAMATR